MTVRELIKLLQKKPLDMEVISVGADCGGYDMETGTNVFLDHSQLEYGGKMYVRISHGQNSQPKLFPTAPVVSCGPTRFLTYDRAKQAGMDAMRIAAKLGLPAINHKIEFCQACNGWHVLVAL